ncbi:hypothetical protein N0V88_005014 [Collariella sp. IMI 366227]|nr:hypothetical protein N0V88_005014 [Collariella sp. IMI 366227]
MNPTIHPVFEPQTCTWQYIVADPSTKSAAIIDPVLDFDPARSTVSTKSADNLLAFVRKHGYSVTALLETHLHADHLTAAKYLQDRLAEIQHGQRPVIGIGGRIGDAQERFAKRYGVEREEWEGAFDKYFGDDEVFMTNPHTENVFCGDSIFNEDVGSARCDFPAATPTIYRPNGTPKPSCTVAEQMAHNKHLKSGTSEADFVGWRTERDAGLGNHGFCIRRCR